MVQNNQRTTRPGGVTGRGFKPGISGNPGGRPKGLSRRVRELVGDDGQAIAEYMLSVMNDEKQRARERMEAAKWLADRAFGRPVQALDVEIGPPEQWFDPAKLSDDDLNMLIALLEKAQPTDE